MPLLQTPKAEFVRLCGGGGKCSTARDLKQWGGGLFKHMRGECEVLRLVSVNFLRNFKQKRLGKLLARKIIQILNSGKIVEVFIDLSS